MRSEEFVSSNFGLSALLRVFNESSSEVRSRIIGIYVFLIGYNVLAWLIAHVVFREDPALLLLALTAYTFGLRHAFDADHISAIDNVTRKLMQERKRPIGVGFFFSLGHSTIVVALTVFIAMTALAVKNFDQVQARGSVL
jgi:high-affinity nickel-transport protein